ncbi:hypothetical protein CALCODRAFT_503588, partial [Calocera cornea HHB12733]
PAAPIVPPPIPSDANPLPKLKPAHTSAPKAPKTPNTATASKSAVGSTRTPASRAKTPSSRPPPSSASASAARVKASTLTPSSSGSASKARPASRARTTASPSPIPAHSRTSTAGSAGTTVTTPRSSALSAPTASSLAKARPPASKSPTMNTIVTGAGGSPAVRRLSMNTDKDTPTKSSTGAARGAPPSAGRGLTRGTPTRGRGAAVSAPKRAVGAPPSTGEKMRQVPGANPPPNQPGGDEATSETVAARELELINAHVPPLRTGTDGLGEPEPGVGAEVEGKGAKLRLAEIMPGDELAVVPPAGGEEQEEMGEEMEEARAREESHPEFESELEFQQEEELVDGERSMSQPDRSPLPSKAVLDSVQLDGIDSVDAEGVARPNVAEQARVHALHDGDEGVGAIPDEEDEEED